MKQREIAEIYSILRDTYPTFDDSDDDWMTNGLSSNPFKSLVSVALSTMTSSPRVIKAALALYEEVSTFEELAEIDDDHLRELIKPVAHYNRKTVSLKKMSRQILERHDGQVPGTRDELMALAGIGRKCTDLTLNFMFDEPTVGVDTHVHRLVNRLGVLSTTSAEATADELTDLTPPEYRAHAHEWLIQHGQKVCVARSPRCDDCVLAAHCAHVQNR